MPNRAKPSLPLRGGCGCGALRYEIGAPPLLLYACHCTDCQRQTGSAFALNMPVPAEAFRLIRGAPAVWHATSPAGARVARWFCGTCGGRTHGERAGRADYVGIRAGTLDDTSWLVPAAHFFLRSAQAWDIPPADAPCFETMPADFRALSKAWRRWWDGGGDGDGTG